MLDHATIDNLASLRRQIDEAEAACGRTLGALIRARGQTRTLAEATPFLSACAGDLDRLAGAVRRAAAEAVAPAALTD
ncbi:hypothetical protein G5B40_13760 [Pikeienuella piscinae]|uniref:Uncharacterized protein n=1 Tax=Pikeienuella piscinae TaxID=2748098 RepID=A0A7L5BXI0_9RHOB|nr:hypothetical protein [Pikeienuella piscinae]QIE56432.1 hypothetical protein G5B40_13760 [Pikeienuella piscinae]